MQRIFLWLLALVMSALGMAHILTPKAELGPVFTPRGTEPVTSGQTGALPYSVSGSDLQIQALVQYEGAYWEDGTGDYVSNVAALMLHNPSDVGITRGKVYLTLQEQEYLFEFTYLPAGGRLLVPEKNRLPYVRGKVTDCRCEELATGDFGTEDSGVAFTQNGLSGIVLENTTGGDFKKVTLSYKLYLQEQDALIGGKTYKITVESLSAGENREIVPPKFVWGYSAVVDIQTEEE